MKASFSFQYTVEIFLKDTDVAFISERKGQQISALTVVDTSNELVFPVVILQIIK